MNNKTSKLDSIQQPSIEVFPDSPFDRLLILMNTKSELFSMNDGSLVHEPTKTEIWIGGGFGFYGWIHPVEIDFSFFQNIRFYFALKKWERKYEILKLKNLKL